MKNPFLVLCFVCITLLTHFNISAQCGYNYAGTYTNDTIYICADDAVSLLSNGFVVDPGSQLAVFIHDGSVVNIYSVNTSGLIINNSTYPTNTVLYATTFVGEINGNVCNLGDTCADYTLPGKPIVFLDPIEIDYQLTCDPITEITTVDYSINGGFPQFSGGCFTGNSGGIDTCNSCNGSLCSFDITVGVGTATIIATDDNTCENYVTFPFECITCSNFVGTISPLPITTCSADTIIIEEPVDAVIDPNSILMFILHDGFNSIGTIFGFDIDTLINNGSYPTNVQMYLTPIVGVPNANGIPSFIDPCTSIALPGTPVLFLDPIQITYELECIDNTGNAEVNYNLYGGLPCSNPLEQYYYTGEYVGTSFCNLPINWNVTGISNFLIVVTDNLGCQSSLTLSDTLFQTCPDSIFLNEIHYQNTGTDINEGIEIVGIAGLDVACYELHFYDGTTGLTYNSETLSGIIPDQDAGFGTLWFPVANLIDTNGAIALYDNCNQQVLQFLSYEGSFTANDGVAQNLISEDILVFEDENTAAGQSLQLIGFGQNYADFVWSAPILATAGQTNFVPSNNSLMNTFQYFSNDPGAIVFCNQQNLNLLENDTTITIEVSATNLTQITDVTIAVLNSSTATENVDVIISDYNLSFTDLSETNKTLTFDITIIDDAELENEEVLKLDISSNGITIPNDIEITILDNDVAPIVYNNYSIPQVTTENTDGIADSIGVFAELTAIVYDINLTNTGLNFTIIDNNNNGIRVFNQSDNLNYTVTQGDEITVKGTIDQFNGLTRIVADSIELISVNNDLIDPMVISNIIDESLESSLIRLPFGWMFSSWMNNDFGFDYYIVHPDYLMDSTKVSVNENSPLASNIPFYPYGEVPIHNNAIYTEQIGIVGQNDSTSSYLDNYILNPLSSEYLSFFFMSIEDIENQFNIKTIQTKNLLSFTSNKTIEKLQLFNTNGQEVAANIKSEIEISNLAKGVYFAIIEIDGTPIGKKILIE